MSAHLEKLVIDWCDAELAYAKMVEDRKGENREEITNKLYETRTALMRYAITEMGEVKYGLQPYTGEMSNPLLNDLLNPRK